MSKVIGCKYVKHFWPDFTPAMKMIFTWQVKEDETQTMCPRTSKRRKSDGRIFLEFLHVSKDECQFCRYAERDDDRTGSKAPQQTRLTG